MCNVNKLLHYCPLFDIFKDHLFPQKSSSPVVESQSIEKHVSIYSICSCFEGLTIQIEETYLYICIYTWTPRMSYYFNNITLYFIIRHPDLRLYIKLSCTWCVLHIFKALCDCPIFANQSFGFLQTCVLCYPSLTSRLRGERPLRLEFLLPRAWWRSLHGGCNSRVLGKGGG